MPGNSTLDFSGRGQNIHSMNDVLAFRKKDWIRFQLPDKRVLEGFVKSISADKKSVTIGKGPDSPESQTFDIGAIHILKVQSFGAPC